MNNQIDASIPVLTEVIKPEELAASPAPSSNATNTGIAANAANTASASPPKNTAPVQPAAMGTTSTAHFADTGNYPGKSEEDWQALEQSLRENVLRQVMTRIDFVLEHRIRDNLADVLQIAVANLSTEIRSGLRNTLEEVITRAVTQEITKAKSSK